MSTKIYDAFECFSGDIFGVFAELKAFRLKYARTVLLEMRKLFKPDADFMTIMSLMKKSIESGMNTPFNVKASAVVYLYTDESHNTTTKRPYRRIFVQFFGIGYDKPYRRLLENLDPEVFSDFHYQNQSDKPDDVTDEDWDARDDLWDRIIGSNTTFSDAGLSFELLPSNFEYDVATVVKGHQTIKEALERLQ